VNQTWSSTLQRDNTSPFSSLFRASARTPVNERAAAGSRSRSYKGPRWGGYIVCRMWSTTQVTTAQCRHASQSRPRKAAALTTWHRGTGHAWHEGWASHDSAARPQTSAGAAGPLSMEIEAQPEGHPNVPSLAAIPGPLEDRQRGLPKETTARGRAVARTNGTQQSEHRDELQREGVEARNGQVAASSPSRQSEPSVR
jgi:hypothetical protein